MTPPRPDLSAAAPAIDPALLCLDVRLATGGRFRPEAAPGFQVMELIRAYGIPIKAECGGSGICATCHIHVPDHWQLRLPAPTGAELARLDEIADASACSRLACQIVMTDDLDGLEVEVQPDSIALTTSFLVG